MLKTTKLEPSVANIIFVNEENIIDEVGGNSKVSEVKIVVKTAIFKR